MQTNNKTTKLSMRLAGIAAVSVVTFGGMMVKPEPAHAIFCSNCSTIFTQMLEYAMQAQQYVEDQAQTAELLNQSAQLVQHGIALQKMLERGDAFAAPLTEKVINDLMALQNRSGGDTIIWSPQGAEQMHREIFPETIPPDPKLIQAYRDLQEQHFQEASMSSKVVSAAVVDDMRRLQEREAEVEAQAALCPGQTCAQDLQRQQAEIAMELAKKQAIMSASHERAAEAKADLDNAARVRAKANWQVDMMGLPTRLGQ